MAQNDFKPNDVALSVGQVGPNSNSIPQQLPAVVPPSQPPGISRGATNPDDSFGLPPQVLAHVGQAIFDHYSDRMARLPALLKAIHEHGMELGRQQAYAETTIPVAGDPFNGQHPWGDQHADAQTTTPRSADDPSIAWVPTDRDPFAGANPFGDYAQGPTIGQVDEPPFYSEGESDVVRNIAARDAARFGKRAQTMSPEDREAQRQSVANAALAVSPESQLLLAGREGMDTGDYSGMALPAAQLAAGPLLGAALRTFPRATAGALGVLGITTGSTEAGERQKPQPAAPNTPAPEPGTSAWYDSQITDLETKIDAQLKARKAAVDQAIKETRGSRTVTYDKRGNPIVSTNVDPKAQDANAARAAQPFDTTISSLQQQRDSLVDRQRGFFERFAPYSYGLPLAALGSPLVQGYFKGRATQATGKLPTALDKAEAIGLSTTFGAGEGAFGTLVPQWYDAEFGEGRAREQARQNLSDPNWWRRALLPAAVIGGGTGLIGSGLGVLPRGTFRAGIPSFLGGRVPPMTLGDFGGTMMPVPRQMPALVRAEPTATTPALPAPAAEEIPIPRSTEVPEAPSPASPVRPEDLYGGDQTIGERLRNGPWPEWPEPGENWRQGTPGRARRKGR